MLSLLYLLIRSSCGYYYLFQKAQADCVDAGSSDTVSVIPDDHDGGPSCKKERVVSGKLVNTLRPRQNGRRFTDDTFKRIF